MPAPTSSREETVAAVDLGSNSFHLLVARVVAGELHVIDKVKERVALAAGLDEDGELDAESQARALECLEKLGQRTRSIPPHRLRAVGTNTLRRARNRRDFLERAEEVLGHEIEVIAGTEEARLIYLGVAGTLQGSERRLVVDIGGGSTECAVGEGQRLIAADSLHMGHVAFAREFFDGGSISEKRMGRAETAASLEVESIVKRMRDAKWEAAVGSSGTILAIEGILRASGWADRGITDRGLRKLRKAVLAVKKAQDLDIEGLRDDRKETIAAGVAILTAVFDGLGIERMQTSEGALREGVVYDLLGRFSKSDVRETTVEQIAERHHVDRAQGARVEQTAMQLMDQVADDWRIDTERDRQVLRWAAQLHEIGLVLSLSGYHKHGGYILRHADMPGFSRDAQQELSLLVLNHRRKLRLGTFDELPKSRRKPDLRLCILLRLAVRLNRNRALEDVPVTRLEASGSELTLTFPRGWLDENPLTRADLENEDARLESAVAMRLRLNEA